MHLEISHRFTGWSRFTCSGRWRRSARGLLLLGVMAGLVPLPARGDDLPETGTFHYGSNWWREYHNDSRTILLLHFGRPQPLALDALAEDGLSQRREQEAMQALLDPAAFLDGPNAFGPELDHMPTPGQSTGMLPAQSQSKGPPPVDEPALPRDRILDYSSARRVIRLGAGMQPVADGRFGAGLRFDGTGPGLPLFEDTVSGHFYGGITMVECWIRVDAYPDAPAAILATGGDNAQFVLRPDGHLEMLRSRPHGRPDEKRHAPGELERILSEPAPVVSSERVPLNTWTHVAVGISQVAQVDSHLGWIWMDARLVASYQSTPNNWFNWFTPPPNNRTVLLGNNHAGSAPFRGVIDELRLSSGRLNFSLPARHFNQRIDLPWRDNEARRPLHFDTPYFLRDGTVFHLGFEDGLAFSRHRAGIPAASFERNVNQPGALATDGIRGRGLILDPRVSLLRIPFDGMSLEEGALEFWARPLNWDNAMESSGPAAALVKTLSLMRIVCADEHGDPTVHLRLVQNRVNPEGAQPAFNPGCWTHFMLVWNRENPHTFYLHRNHEHRHTSPQVLQVQDRATRARNVATLKPLYLEFGVAERGIGDDRREPILVIDEIVGYDYAPQRHELTQAYRRVQTEIEPAHPFEWRYNYRYSIARLTGSLETLLPDTIRPRDAFVGLEDEQGRVIIPPQQQALSDGKASFTLRDGGTPVPYGRLQFTVRVTDQTGNTVIDGRYPWHFEQKPWRGNTLGQRATTPPPWTPVTVRGHTIETRMTTWELGTDGLPTAIVNTGENVLAAPMRLLENGHPMRGGNLDLQPSRDIETLWTSRFSGETCDVLLDCRAEYDGLVRFALTIEPKTPDGTIGSLAFEIPMKPEHATHRGFQRGDIWNLLTVRRDSPEVLSPRRQALPHAIEQAERQRQPVPSIETFEAYMYWSQMILSGRDRGIYWFADNLAGWGQSPRVDTQQYVKSGDRHSIVLNLVAEAGPYRPGTPIVFGILPHPARPVPANFRRWDRTVPPDDPDGRSVYGSTFFPWPEDPKAGEMRLFPKPHPNAPQAGPSWDYAEERGRAMHDLYNGYITFYCSLAYFSCRAGRYDGWEWRNGSQSRVSLADSMVEYATWEINEWVRRGIYTAIYLDDSYSWPCVGENAVLAGQAIRLPNGEIQPGVMIWNFRELMRRWRNILLEHTGRPMLLSHHTHHWMYPGMVFAESALDGEGAPTIRVNSPRDFIDGLSLERAELLQNPHLWGVSRYFMASIWEFGPLAKGENPHPAWSWRMARSAQATLSHFENPTMFVDQGGQVFKAFWEALLAWGGGDPAVPFVPYWQADPYLRVDGQGGETLASFYRQPGSLFLIVSNRRRENADIPVRLNLRALGLPATPVVRALDGAYLPPPGEDPVLLQREMRKQPPTPSRELSMAPEVDTAWMEDLMLDEADRPVRGIAGSPPPTLDGDLLTIPVRARDFRVVLIEAPGR